MPSKSDPRRDTRQRVLELTAAGHTGPAIARALRITPARVYQLRRELREAGLLLEVAR